MASASPSRNDDPADILDVLDAAGTHAVLDGGDWQFTIAGTRGHAPAGAAAHQRTARGVLHVTGTDCALAAQRLADALEERDTRRLQRGSALWQSTAAALSHDLRNDIVALADLAGLASLVGADDAHEISVVVAKTVAQNRHVLDLLSAPKLHRGDQGRWKARAQPLSATATVWASDGLLDTLKANIADARAAALDTAPVRTLAGWAWTLRGPWNGWEEVDDARVGLCGMLALAADGDLLDGPDGMLLSLPGCDRGCTTDVATLGPHRAGPPSRRADVPAPSERDRGHQGHQPHGDSSDGEHRPGA